MVAGGYWKPGKDADACLALLEVGVTDLFYKLENGYINYAHGKAGKRAYDINIPHHDFAMTRSLWRDVVRPYHQLRAGK